MITSQELSLKKLAHSPNVILRAGNTEISRGPCQGHGRKEERGEGAGGEGEEEKREEANEMREMRSPCTRSSSGSSSRGVRIEC